jgi:hypothetical protein
MDSISTARDFFINQQGLSPDQADMIVSKGMEAYNQQSQPQQNMMQMASGGIARLGYQMGGSPMGVGAMPMDTGQSLQVPQQMPTNFSSAQSITSNPLLNYGQPQIGQAGGTPLSMNRGGIARLGYQDFQGGEAMMQPQMGGEMNMPQMNEQQALETIIQLLIEQGIDPETALQLAAQILQIFAQGGESAVEAFANQLEQQEQVQEMAGGGIAGLYPRQGYFLGKAVKAIGKVFKGVGKAIKSIAKSPIGRLAITIGANMLLPGAGTAFGAALQSAAVNLGLQAIGGGKINPLEALTAGAGGYFGFSGAPANAVTTGATPTIDGVNATTKLLESQGIMANPNLIPPDVGSYAGSVQKFTDVGMITPSPQDVLSNVKASNLANSQGQTLQQLGELTPKPTTFIENIQNIPGKIQSGIQSLYQDPMGTIKKAAESTFDYATDPENRGTIATVGGLTLLGSQLGIPRNEGEDDASYAKRLQETQGYLTQYGRNLNINNPYFYQREGAVNPFAPTMAANGGIMGYAKGGSMVPPARQIEGGVIELDARKTGGYIPYGKKERVDDVPAMLAKDEFVFTSRAVKAAGGGSAQRGAKKMYALMKQLESKGARA